MNKDYIFQINWEDRYRNLHKVGFLAKIEDTFYCVISDKKNADSAYKNGFIGIPGFNPDEIYKSSEMFDFFRNRILMKKDTDICEELAKTRGTSMVDSFSVDEVSKRLFDKYKDSILNAYSLQLKKEEIKRKSRKLSQKKEVKVQGIG